MSKKEQADKSQPMDPTTKEVLVGTPQINRQRVCWAAKTLVAEVDELFPETPVEYSNYNGRNTALDVTFDFTVLDLPDRDTAIALLELLSTDSRVDEVIEGGAQMDAQVLVSFKPNATTQDSREPFGLGDALVVLDEDADQ